MNLINTVNTIDQLEDNTPIVREELGYYKMILSNKQNIIIKADSAICAKIKYGDYCKENNMIPLTIDKVETLKVLD